MTQLSKLSSFCDNDNNKSDVSFLNTKNNEYVEGAKFKKNNYSLNISRRVLILQ